MATLKKLRGQTATFSVTEDDGGLDVPIGILDNPSVSAPEQEVQELRGTGSTEWQDVQKTETAVLMSGDVSAMAIDAWDQLIDWDELAGELNDSAEVKLFEGSMEFEAADGSTKEIIVGPGYIDGGVELSGSREEWIGSTIELRCKTIQEINNVDVDDA